MGAAGPPAAGVLGLFCCTLHGDVRIPTPTIYILTGILGSKYPALNPFSHASGHLWLVLFGGGTSMMAVIHLISNGLVVMGFLIMWKGWKLIHGSKGGLVTEGPYAYVRHPEYVGLFIVMTGI